jgi:hypothetical protein
MAPLLQVTPSSRCYETNETYEAIAKVTHFVILNEVKDLKLLKIRDSSLRSE